MPEQQTKQIGLGGISIKPERLRALRPDVVDQIAESMATSGQIEPIVLRPRGDTDEDGNGYLLVAGWHRLEAAKKLKWPSIRSTIFTGVDADQAELIEIDENLMRADLTPAETAMHVVRRQKIYEDIHGKAKASGGHAAQKKMGHKASADSALAFTTDTAKKTGKSKRKLQVDAARGKKVKVLTEIAGTSLDKGVELDALAKLPEDEQRKLADAAKAGENVSAKTKVKQVYAKQAQAAIEPPPKKSAPIPSGDDDPHEKCRERLRTLIMGCIDKLPSKEWGRLIAETRDEIVSIELVIEEKLREESRHHLEPNSA